jgi:hypothetical protein
MPSPCQQIKTAYEQLQSSQARFVAAYAKGKESNDFTLAKQYQAEWTAAYAALEALVFFRFTVSDALNPFRDYLLAGGIPDTDPAVQERKDREVNLEAILAQDIVAYRAANLERWAQALEAITNDIRLTPEKRAIIEQEIKDGAIIVFMPGRAAQLETTPEQYQPLKPVWIKDNEVQTLADAYMWDHTAKLITNQNPALVKDVPERPYLVLRKLSAKVDPRTTDKTVDALKAEVVAINQERAGQGMAPVYPANPAGWAAFEARATQHLEQSAPQPFANLTPPDDINNSYHRFIQLPLSSVGNVPAAYLYPDHRKVSFGGSPTSSISSAIRAARLSALPGV